MKKLYILVLGICLVWMAKLSYDVFKISAQQNDLLQVSRQLEKANSNLNDQMVAVQRLHDGEKTESAEQRIEQVNTDKLSSNLLKQKLALVEFALKQQQPYYALERLTELSQGLAAYPISPTLKESLEQAIAKDTDVLKQYIASQDEQDQVIQKVLHQLDLQLKQESLNTHLVPAKEQDKYFWQKWLTIDSVKTPATQLPQRALLIKEAQLRLIMARQILLDGEYTQYLSELNEIQVLLKQLPDQKAKQIIQQLESLKKITKISPPKLITSTLIG